MAQSVTGPVRVRDRAGQRDRCISFAFEAFGRRLVLSLCDESLLDAVVDILPAGWNPVGVDDADRHFRLEWLTAAEPAAYREGFHLYDGDEFLRWAPDPALAVDGIESEIEHDIAEFADPWLFMHAGVVAWQGQAILLPGESHAGKSTLTAALVEAGATYFSDEYAVLDAHGRVWPFPRRLSLRQGPFGPAHRMTIRQAGSPELASLSPIPVGHITLITYRAGQDFWIDTLPRGSAILELCQHMVAIQRRPQDVLAALNALTRSVPVLHGERGDARETARRLLEIG
jgi:hypothetical protein